MFRFLGQIVRRAWALVLLGWALLLVGGWWFSPAWNTVAQDNEFAFLPPDSPSRRAEEVYAKAFPEAPLGSNIVLVLHQAAKDAGHLDRDRKFITEVVYPGVRQIAEAEGGLADEPAPSEAPLFSDEKAATQQPRQRQPLVARIRTPDEPGAGALLVSPDGQVLLVVVELTTEFISHANWPLISRVEDLVRQWRQQGKLPPGLGIAVTGSAVIGRDHTTAELQSARATTFLTVVLVIALLIVIYRAPLLALIPLATVYLAVRLAIDVLAMLARSGHITVFQGLEVYITILAYGAGVDYCLFLTARYKEELDHGAQPADAVAHAVENVGAALVASAATVICGIAMMYFAEFGKFREAGLAIPLSLALVLCATLTFSPSLLRLAGRWAFWPHRAGATVSSGRAVEPRGGFFQTGELERIWDKVGQLLLRRAGLVWLSTVALLAPLAVIAGLFYNHLSYDLIGELPANAPSVQATRLLQAHFPAGTIGPVTVLLVDPHVDFRSAKGRAIVGQLTDRLRAQKEALGLADIRSLTAPLGITEAGTRAFADPNMSEDVRRQVSTENYTSSLGERNHIGTRLDLILTQSPFAAQSLDDLDRIEQTIQADLPAEMRPDTQLYFVGTTASVRDLAQVLQRDRKRIQLLVLASVFLILIVLLRRFVVPVYLLLSVLFSFFVTLGATFAVFWLLDPRGFQGIDWQVAIFLFTILIAVGEDYNIFLLTRIGEEERRHGPVRGITEALDRTGPVISSCGIIMAGTFASLLAGSLSEMKQLGFALAFGVLLDTFVVRPVLVPAFLILLGSGRFRLRASAGRDPATPADMAERQAQDRFD